MYPRTGQRAKAGAVPHLKCEACKTRLYRAGTSARPVHDVCGGCGSPLEPVGGLADILGFQWIGSRAPGAPRGVGDLAARRAAREATLAEARLDAHRWIDDDGYLQPEAVAMPRPQTT